MERPFRALGCDDTRTRSQGFTLGWYETPPWGYLFRTYIGPKTKVSDFRFPIYYFRFVFLRVSASLREILRKLRFPATFQVRLRSSDFRFIISALHFSAALCLRERLFFFRLPISDFRFIISALYFSASPRLCVRNCIHSVFRFPISDFLFAPQVCARRLTVAISRYRLF